MIFAQSMIQLSDDKTRDDHRHRRFEKDNSIE